MEQPQSTSAVMMDRVSVAPTRTMCAMCGALHTCPTPATHGGDEANRSSSGVSIALAPCAVAVTRCPPVPPGPSVLLLLLLVSFPRCCCAHVRARRVLVSTLNDERRQRISQRLRLRACTIR